MVRAFQSKSSASASSRQPSRTGCQDETSAGPLHLAGPSHDQPSKGPALEGDQSAIPTLLARHRNLVALLIRDQMVKILGVLVDVELHPIHGAVELAVL